MQRRSFLALLGLSPVAPAIASDAMTAPVPSPMPAAAYASTQDLFGSSRGSGTYVSRAAQLKRALQLGLISREDLKRAFLDSTRGHRDALDHDIRAWKSFSETAKHRAQRARMAERYAASADIECDPISDLFSSIRTKVLGPGEHGPGEHD